MASLVSNLGLHLRSDSGVAAQLHLDTGVARRDNGLAIGLVATTTTSWFMHRTDAGRRGVVWKSSNADFRLNVGGAQGTVAIRYLYSDTLYDLTNSSDRVTLGTQLSAAVSLATLQGLADQTGRYRYLRFDLTSVDGSEDPTVTESAESQQVTSLAEVVESLVLVVGEPGSPRPVRFAAGSTPTLQFVHATSSDALTRFSLAGATVTVRIDKSFARANATGQALIGPVAVTLDDADLGESSVTLTDVQSALTPGWYAGEVRVVRGGTTLKHFFDVEVFGSMP